MEFQKIHPNARFAYNSDVFTAEDFCAQNFAEPWLKDVQNAVLFWLSDAADLKISTSGSTGKPKEISLAKKVLWQSARATLKAFDLHPKSNAFLFLPTTFIGGKMMVFRTLIGGLHLQLVSPKSALPALNKAFDFVALTPLQASKSIDKLDNFKRVLLGGGPVHANLLTELQKVNAEVFNSYGMTETASHVALRALNGKAKSDAFFAVIGVTFSVDQRNCLVIDAPHLNVENLITNDVVELLDAQHFIWKGRADNVINSGGLKIFPEEIEQVLETQIAQHFFVGSLPDAALGHKLVLFVEGAFDGKLDFSVLPKLHQPKETVFLPRFAYTETDKIHRQKTQDLVQNV